MKQIVQRSIQHGGFALLEVFLAVSLMVLATYGGYVFMKSSGISSSTQMLEQRLLNIAQNYAVFLDSTTTTSTGNSTLMNGDKLSGAFLASINMPSEACVKPVCSSTSTDYTYVYTGTVVHDSASDTDKRVVMNFLDTTSTSTNSHGSNFLVIGLWASQTQLARLMQDLGQSFGFYVPIPASNLSSSVARLSKIPTCSSGSDCQYVVYLTYPRVDTLPSGIALNKPSLY